MGRTFEFGIIRGFEYGRPDARQINDDLVRYKQVTMSLPTYRAICEAENLVNHLFENAKRVELATIELYIK